MKRIYISLIAIAALLSGCSAMNVNKKAEVPASEPAEVATTVVTPVDTLSLSAPELNLPATEAAKPQKVRHRSRLYHQLSGEWTIIKVGKTEIPYEDEMPYLIFDEKQWVFYASNGCNVLNGNFVYDGEYGIKFGTVASTMRYCPEVKYDSEINAVLSDGNLVTAKLEQSGRETYLSLLNRQGQTVMRLRRHNLDFMNGQWDVTRIGDNDVKDEGVNIFFDIAERKVHGNSGCNYFNGSIEIDPYRSSSISMKNMAVTMRSCPNLDTEMKFLVALEQVTQVKTSGHNTLHLLDRQGHTVLTLHREEK